MYTKIHQGPKVKGVVKAYGLLFTLWGTKPRRR